MNSPDSIRNCMKFRVAGTAEPALPESGTPVPITGDLVHIWSARYSDLERYYPIISGLISADEVSRAAGFKKPGDTRHFILRHGMARVVLAWYLGKDPRKIRFIHEGNGRPNLHPEKDIPNIRFSLSRTDAGVCLGISGGSGLGLDIVKNDPHYPFSAAAEYLFTPGERGWIEQANPEKQYLRFFRIWSIKEALLKSTGSDARFMRYADVSGIMKNGFLDGFYPVSVGMKVMHFFINESGCGVRHHCALAALPGTNTGSEN